VTDIVIGISIFRSRAICRARIFTLGQTVATIIDVSITVGNTCAIFLSHGGFIAHITLAICVTVQLAWVCVFWAAVAIIMHIVPVGIFGLRHPIFIHEGSQNNLHSQLNIHNVQG